MHQNRGFTLSICLAVFAVLMVDSYVTSSIDAAHKEFGAERGVVVAKRDIKELEMLDDSNLEILPFPGKFAQPGTSNKPGDFRGTIAIAPMAKGEQVTRTKITVAGLRPGLARQIASGKRAVTMKVSDESAVAKLLKPGDRVDVVATIDPTGAGQKAFYETRVILQDVVVLATGRYVTNSLPGIYELDPFRGASKTKVPLAEYASFTTVTLEVDASQLTTAVFAVHNLELYLALRNNDDIGARDDFGKTMLKDFVGAPAAKPPAPAGPPAKK